MEKIYKQTVTIDVPQEKHAEEIARICSVGWKQTVEGQLSEEYQAINVEEWYNLKRVKEDIKKGSYTHVALLGEKVVGVIGGAIIEPGVGQVFVLYVEDKYRYQGIGRKLLDALTKEQLEQGAKELWVTVQEDNQLGIPFYEARGFEFQEKRVGVTETNEEFGSLRYKRPLLNKK